MMWFPQAIGGIVIYVVIMQIFAVGIAIIKQDLAVWWGITMVSVMIGFLGLALVFGVWLITGMPTA